MGKVAKMPLLTALFVVTIVNFGFVCGVGAQPSEPHPANALWLEPSSITLDITQVGVGYKFNITVWLNVSVNTFSWQVEVHFNSTYFNAKRAGLTAGATSDWATHRTGGSTYPASPVIDNAAGWVCQGEMCLGDDYVPPVTASLMWIEFELVQLPPINHYTFDFSIPYSENTFIMDESGVNVVPMDTIKGTDMVVIPEYMPFTMLSLLTTLSMVLLLLRKRLRN